MIVEFYMDTGGTRIEEFCCVPMKIDWIERTIHHGKLNGNIVWFCPHCGDKIIYIKKEYSGLLDYED